MSINKYNSETGELVALAGGQQIWIGTQAAHDQAIAAGTMPNNCLVSILDNAEDAQASQVIYDNTTSGLEADNVQDAIDEINDNSTWTLLDTKTGNTAISLPSKYNELHICVEFGGVNWKVPMHLTNQETGSFFTGFWAAANNGGFFCVLIANDKSTIKMTSADANGSSVLSSSVIKVYYR